MKVCYSVGVGAFVADPSEARRALAGVPRFADNLDELAKQLKAAALPEDATLVFGAEVGAYPIPCALLFGDVVLLLDIVRNTISSAPLVYGRGDRLAHTAAQLRFGHDPCVGRRVQSAVLVAKDKNKPIRTGGFQILPLERFADFLGFLRPQGDSTPADTFAQRELRLPADWEDTIGTLKAQWIEKLLQGFLSDAEEAAKALRGRGFVLYTVSSIPTAHSYLKARCAGTRQTYGYTACSQARNLFDPSELGVLTDFGYVENGENRGWEFRYYNDPDSEDYCTKFNRVALENAVKGHSLDLPVVGWGDDLRWAGKWKPRMLSKISAHLPAEQAANAGAASFAAYETLLSAARMGILLYAPSSSAYSDTLRGTMLRAGLERYF